MKNIGGVFVVLLCGLSLAIIVAVLEFCWNSRKNAQSDHQVRSKGLLKYYRYGMLKRIDKISCNILQSLCSEMAEELRFAMRCHGSRQKPALKRNCARCSPDNT